MFRQIKWLWLQKDQKSKESANNYFLGRWVVVRRGFLGFLMNLALYVRGEKKRQHCVTVLLYDKEVFFFLRFKLFCGVVTILFSDIK